MCIMLEYGQPLAGLSRVESGRRKQNSDIRCRFGKRAKQSLGRLRGFRRAALRIPTPPLFQTNFCHIFATFSLIFLAFCNIFAFGANSAPPDADFAAPDTDFAPPATNFDASDDDFTASGSDFAPSDCYFCFF